MQTPNKFNGLINNNIMYSSLGKYIIMKFNKTQNNETQETQMKLKN